MKALLQPLDLSLQLWVVVLELWFSSELAYSATEDKKLKSFLNNWDIQLLFEENKLIKD